MANLVYMAKSAWTGLLDSIRAKAGTAASMTVSEATTAVQNIPGGEEYAELVERTISAASGSMSKIGDYAFASCKNLKTASFPLATAIGSSAFANCSSLSTASFPLATDIGSHAFYSCSRLTEVNMPSARSVGANTFYGCSLLETVYMPSVSVLGYYMFNNCSALGTVDFPSVSLISAYVFNGCVALSTVSFPVTTFISDHAFVSCVSLKTASFPLLRTISSAAFQRCYNLLSLYLLGSSFVTLGGINVFSSTPISNYTTSTGGVHGSIFVPASLYDRYISASNWSVYSSRFVSV